MLRTKKYAKSVSLLGIVMVVGLFSLTGCSDFFQTLADGKNAVIDGATDVKDSAIDGLTNAKDEVLDAAAQAIGDAPKDAILGAFDALTDAAGSIALTDDTQRQELAEYISHSLDQSVSADKHPCVTPNPISPGYVDQPLTEIREGELYFCLELRKVCVGDMEIELTVKEFDALYLLISNRNRILTFETLARQIWGKEYVDITAKTIHNLMSRVRHKLQVNPSGSDYIKSVRGVGYKFESE